MKLIRTATLLLSFLLSVPLFAGQPVNVNTADADEIAHGLDGVGMAKAKAIIAYRDEHGQFKHADELVNVKGIGLKTIEKNREYIRIDGEDTESKDSGES